jgi:hypothetical protein
MTESQQSKRLGGECYRNSVSRISGDITHHCSFVLLYASKKCDGFMVASTMTDVKLGTVAIPHEGPEEYNNSKFLNLTFLSA